jgi:hypothetical protein
MKRTSVLVLLLLVLTVAAANPAAADPPPKNKNANVLTFHCVRGEEEVSFQAVGILQSAQLAGQLLGKTGVIVFRRIIVDGQTVFEIPGQVGRPDLWSCSIEEVPGTFVDALVTPRR